MVLRWDRGIEYRISAHRGDIDTWLNRVVCRWGRGIECKIQVLWAPSVPWGIRRLLDFAACRWDTTTEYKFSAPREDIDNWWDRAVFRWDTDLECKLSLPDVGAVELLRCR